MTRLMMVIFAIVSVTMMGIFMVAALTMGLDTAKPIIVSVIVGFVIAIPVTWVIARQLA